MNYKNDILGDYPNFPSGAQIRSAWRKLNLRGPCVEKSREIYSHQS